MKRSTTLGKLVVLHIGLDKTGTTAIQDYCFEHSVQLERLSIYWVPPSKARYLAAGARQVDEERLRSLVDDIRNGPNGTYVISFEGLYRLDAERLNLFLSALSGFRTKALIYLRRREDKFRSGLAERLKIRSTRSKNAIEPALVQNAFEKLFGKRSADYEQIVRRWQDGVARTHRESKIELALYEKASLQDGDVVNDFLNRIGCSKSEIKAHRQDDVRSRANRSLSPAAQALMALASVLVRGDNELQMFRRLIMEHDDPHERYKSRVPDEVFVKMNAEHAAGDRALAREFFGRDQLFREEGCFSYGLPSDDKYERLIRALLANREVLEAAKAHPEAGERVACDRAHGGRDQSFSM